MLMVTPSHRIAYVSFLSPVDKCTFMTSSMTFAQSLAVMLVVAPRAGDELISSNHG